MKIYFKRTHEVFCCGLKLLKDTFHDTNISIDFRYFTSKHSTSIHDRNHSFCKKNVQGVVVLSLQMINGMESPILSLYPIDSKKNNIQKIQQEFENNIICEVKNFYLEHLNSPKDPYDYILLVDLYENKLLIRKGRI